MSELDGSLGILAMDEVCDTLQRNNLTILPKTRVLRTDPTTRFNGGGLNKDEASTLKSELAKVNKMKIC
jgi:hypothetical protein